MRGAKRLYANAPAHTTKYTQDFSLESGLQQHHKKIRNVNKIK